MKKKFIAYEGEKFTIEWYFDSKGKSAALEYYEELPLSQKKKLFHLFNMFADSGMIRNEEKFRYEGNQVYAFKPSPDRFLCFFYQGSKIIVTNAYKKQSNKMPEKEKQKALRAKEDYNYRYTKGSYYEKEN